MNITEMNVDDFGAWHNLVLSDLQDRATLFYGPNEAGKTTLLNFVRTMCYGFSDSRCQRYLPPASGGIAGGSIDVTSVSGRFQIHRSAPANYQGGPGTLRLSSPDGGHQGNELLATILSGIDETIFNNVFAVGLTQIQQLSTLSDTEAASQLYGLATGVDRVSLYEVTQQLEQQRESLLSDPTSKQASTSCLDALLEQRKRLRKELKALRRDADHCVQLRKDYADLTATIKRQEVTKQRLDGEGNWNEVSASVRQQWSRCRELNTRLGRLGPLPDVPDHIGPRVVEITKQVKVKRASWEALRDERKRTKAKAAKLRGRDALYPHAAEIEALDRQRTHIVELEIDVTQCKAQVDELEFELQAQLEGLGLQTGTSARQLPQISDRVIEGLRVPAREMRELRARVEAAKRAGEDARESAKEVQLQLETASLRYGGETLDAALQRSRNLVEQLERRLHLDEHREAAVRSLDEMRRESKYWLQRGVLPWRVVLIVCAIFSTGLMLLLTGLLIDWFPLRASSSWPMIIIGGTLSVLSIVIKNSLEYNALDRAGTVDKQMDNLLKKQADMGAESAELDRTLPAGSGHLDQRLIDARDELAEIEQLLPLRDRQQELEHEARAAEHQATFAVRQLKDARRAWKASLRSVGLPDALTPAQIGQMGGKVSEITVLRNRIQGAKQQLNERQQELATLRARIAQLQSLAGFTAGSESLGQQLNRLKAELEKHARSGRELTELRTHWDELAKQQKGLAAEAERLMADRRRLLFGHGISDTREFRDVQARVSKARRMRSERNDLLGEIAGVLGDEFTVKQLQKLLDQNPAKLTDRLDKFDQEHAKVGSELGQLYERAGELKQQLAKQLEDRRHERKALQLSVVDEQIRQALNAWRRAALASAALEKVRQTYESKRQPVALAEASRYLERLSEGRYTRIWTPMGREALRVDDAQGNSLSVEKLSRGTREQLYLALRLALVASYKRRGASMPLVLDDVFVNFDDQRAEAAARVLFDVAESGQQMLIFTCHQRIRHIFESLGGDVRDLPDRTETSKPRRELSVEPTAPVEITSHPVAESVQVKTAAAPAMAELPVYDAESWADQIDVLALPRKPDRQQENVAGQLSLADVVTEDMDSKEVWDDGVQPEFETVAAPSSTRFAPAWRDEWMEPLPDLDDDEFT